MAYCPETHLELPASPQATDLARIELFGSWEESGGIIEELSFEKSWRVVDDYSNLLGK